VLDQGRNLGPRLAFTLGQGFQYPDALGLSLCHSTSMFTFATFLSLPHKLADCTPGRCFRLGQGGDLTQVSIQLG
jgi:hypothetical protein